MVCMFLKKNIRKLVASNYRYIYSLNKVWPNEYNFDVAKEIETYWHPVLSENQKNYSENTQLKNVLPKKYILSMFPYPSGRLHMGHIRVYTLSDVLARFYRMLGFYVIHPIGWDAFGLPAENAAIERNVLPSEWTQKNVDYMRQQLKDMSFSFDWNREIFTCHPDYYKWTQYLFLKLHENGLAYQTEALVNWDPVDKTVLAFEQIDENGKSWRSGAVVEKKYLKQWFIRSTALSKSLLDALGELNTDDWKIIKKYQKLWIGKCDGCHIEFALENTDTRLVVYTKKPYGIYGASHITISSDNILKKIYYKDMNEGDRLPCNALNPMTNEKIPIFLSDKVDYGVLNVDGKFHHDAHLAIPSLNETDMDFSVAKNLKYTNILNDGKLVNSGQLNGLSNGEAFEKICETLRSMSIGGYLTSGTLKDWVLSRQRYWGTPCPIIYCDKCKVVPVPYDSLPVKLPVIDNLSIKGFNELKNSDWRKIKCPKCNGDAVRETDTLDTFIDSSWYFLRYLDSKNTSELISPVNAEQLMPVDIYIGGAEHALTHLFVSRFISHFLHGQNLLKHPEPFKRFIAIGMVKGESFRTKAGKYVEPKHVEKRGDEYFSVDCGDKLERNVEKMSKSKLNGVDPEDIVKTYGIDFTRLFILGFVHPRSDRDFLLNKDMVDGTLNLLRTVWDLVGSVVKSQTKATIDNLKSKKTSNSAKNVNDEEMYHVRNSNLATAIYNLTVTFNMPVYLVSVSKIAKFLKKVPVESRDQNFNEMLVEVLILLSPTIPHFTSECWNALKSVININGFEQNKLIIEQKWPKVDDDFPIPLFFVVNSKKIGKHEIASKHAETLKYEDALELFKTHEQFGLIANDSIDNYKIEFDNQYPLKATLTISQIKNANE